jgi:hypothetical protein
MVGREALDLVFVGSIPTGSSNFKRRYMALFGSKKELNDNWENANIYKTPLDFFYCKKCDIDFNLDSDKIKGKNIVCPICLKNLKPWLKEKTMD